MPDSSVLTFSDPYEYQRSIRAASVQLVVAEPGTYWAKLTRMDLHRVWMQRSQESLARAWYSTTAESRRIIYFLTDDQQAPVRISGIEVPPDRIMVYSSGSEHHHYSSAACRWGTMSLAPDDLAAAGRAIAGRDLTSPAWDQLIQPSPRLMSRLLRLHESAGRLAATVPDILAHPEVARAMEQELVRVMVACLTDGAEIDAARPAHNRVPVMRRLERVLEENPGRPLYMPELCAAIGVSARTLQLHCHEHLRMGPHQYLWLRRMNLVRRALAQAAPAETNVTRIATEHGFWELGRFSVAYRRLFGEPPSATLRREPDGRKVAQTAQGARALARFA